MDRLNNFASDHFPKAPRLREVIHLPQPLWLIAGLLAVVLAAPIPAQRLPAQDRYFRVEASSFEYRPAALRVNPGDRVTIDVVATDVVHGLYVDGYDLAVTAEPGQTARLAFVAGKAGTFRLRCSVTCGPLHPFMVGRLTVGPNSLLWRSLGLAVLAVAGVIVLHRGRASGATQDRFGP